ncbi:MAG: 50S ribosomal protein L18 [Candidatus Woesearchaeota archaeon]
MATSSRYVVQYRRRREGKTNYRKRLKLLKSRKIRLVIRKTNTSIISQLVQYKPEGDFVIYGNTSKVLKDYGWNHSFKCLPAAYLFGLYMGKKIKGLKINDLVIDLGLHPSTKGGRIYAFLKGVIDAGVSLNVDSDMFPAEERLIGMHIDENLKNDVEKVKKAILS